MSGYRINEEDIQKARRQLRRKNLETTREYAIQKLESMHSIAKNFAAADPATVKELEKALEEQEDDSEGQAQSDDQNQISRQAKITFLVYWMVE